MGCCLLMWFWIVLTSRVSFGLELDHVHFLNTANYYIFGMRAKVGLKNLNRFLFMWCTESLINHIFLDNNKSLWMGLLIGLIIFTLYINSILCLLTYSACMIWWLWFWWYVMFWRWEGSWSIYWETSALQRMLISPCNQRVYGTSIPLSLFDTCILCYLLRINNVGIDVFVATYST